MRKIAPHDLLEQLAEWSTRAFKYDLFRSLQPSRLKDLQPNRMGSVGTFSHEVAWSATLLKLHLPTIRRFMQLKGSLEETLINGNERDCFEKLDLIEELFGPSLWAVSTRIALLQIFRGIESQKEYIAEVRHNAPQVIHFLAHWWGVRAEEGTSLERYSSRLNRQLAKAQLDPELKAFYEYALMGLFPADEAESLLFGVSNASTIIDLYQLFSDLLVVSVGESRNIAPALLQAADELGLGDLDPRIEKALFLSGHRTKIVATKIAILDFRDVYYAEIDQGALDALAGVTPVGIEELAAASYLHEASPASANVLTAQISSLISQLSDKSIIGIRSANDLMRLGSSLDKLSIGQWCLIRALETQQSDITIENILERLRLLNTHDLEPFLLAFAEGSTQRLYESDLAPHYGGRRTFYAAQLAGGLIDAETAKDAGISNSFITSISIVHAIRKGEFEQALAISSVANSDFKKITKLTGEAHIRSLIELGQLDQALITFAAWHLQDRTITLWLPLENLSEAIKRSGTLFDHMIELPILYDALARTKGGEYSSLKAYSAEDFVSSFGVDRPSQLDLSLIRSPLESIIYFYSEICTSQVLRLSTAYQTERELDDEIISICRILTEIDPDRLEIYEDRARELVRARSIKDALKELQRSKVSIDEDALRAWLREELEEDYNRYIAMLRSGVAVVDDQYRKQIIKAVASGEIPASLFDVPENEASALFASLVLRIYGELTYNPEHGLDCYLSLRIRHGTLSGQLRGPVEREHIVTRRDATTREYKPNQYWGERLSPHIYDHEHSRIMALLSNFSRDLDKLISDLTDQRIQVFRKDKPDGLFRLQVNELTIYGLATEVEIETSFDQFAGLCIDTFWSQVDISLENVRRYIDGQLRTSIRDQFDRLDTELLYILTPHIAGLSDAIRRARTDTGLRLDAMRDWFVQPIPSSSVPFEIRELVDIALTTIKGFRPEFSPIVSIKAETIPPLTGALRLSSDIFFILFENISLYSGNPVDPAIEIETTIAPEKLLFRVTNDIEPNVDTDRILEHVAVAKGRIDSGAYLNAVRSEGGTGLPKLAKLIKGREDRPPLQFGLSEDRKTFFVAFDLGITLIGGELENAS